MNPRNFLRPKTAGARSASATEDSGPPAFRAGIASATLMFALLLLLIFLPGKRGVGPPVNFVIVASGIWLYCLLRTIFRPAEFQTRDITLMIFAFLTAWELSTKTFDVLIQALFPAPEDVFNVFTRDAALMVRGVFSSLSRLLTGMTIALVTGNLLGLVTGWNLRLRKDFFPIAKVLAPIPPMIYTPYLIALMPDFTSASIAVISLGLFWPTFMGMINNVGAMDRRIIDSAKAMAVSTATMLLRVILPCLMPGIVRNLRVQFSTLFMVLMMAEMIGAQSGLGFFIKKYSDYADYTRTMAGIILVGLVITLMNALLSVVEEKTIRWKHS